MTESSSNTPENEINLTEKDPTLKVMRLAAGWELKKFVGEDPLDADLSCFLLNKDGQTREDPDFVFYNNLKSADMSVRHLGDNHDGFGKNDDEAIIIDTNALSYDIYKIVFVVSIYLANERNQSFAQIPRSFVRVVNEINDGELTRDTIETDMGNATAIEFCELERIGAEWIFRPIHAPTAGGLKEIAEKYGCMITTIG